MLLLSIDGWLNGISATSIVIFSCTLGIFIIIKATRFNAKLLMFLGLATFLVGLMYIAPSMVDFFAVLITNTNLDQNSMLFANVFSWMWMVPITIISIYIGAEFLIPEKKWYIISIYIVLGFIIELFLFLNPLASFYFIYPANPGEYLVEENLIIESPVGILGFIFMLSILIFCGFGFLYRSIRSEGILKKKYLTVSFGFILYTISGIFDGLFPMNIAILIIFRICPLLAACFLYLGLREESAEPKKEQPKKEISIEDGIFRLTKRPDHISEEEVSISKEKKICLVCKGSLTRAIYICPDCNTFYCKKCSDTLTSLENACWVCNTPIDESKPSKPFEKFEAEVEIENKDKK